MLENPEVTVLFEDAEEEGVVDVLEIELVAAALDLDDDEVATLRGELESRGVADRRHRRHSRSRHDHRS